MLRVALVPVVIVTPGVALLPVAPVAPVAPLAPDGPVAPVSPAPSDMSQFDVPLALIDPDAHPLGCEGQAGSHAVMFDVLPLFPVTLFVVRLRVRAEDALFEREYQNHA